ncbi:hypothetical protein D3C86_1754730 [compost metagenome]
MHRVRQTEHRRAEAVGAQRGVVLEEAGLDQTLGQARDRGPGQPGTFRQFAIAEHISAGAERAQDLDAAFERAIGKRAGRAATRPAPGILHVHDRFSCTCCVLINQPLSAPATPAAAR